MNPKGDPLIDFWVHKLASVNTRLMKEASPIERCNLKEFGAEQPTDEEKFRYIRKTEPDAIKRFRLQHPTSFSIRHPKTDTEKLNDLLKIP